MGWVALMYHDVAPGKPPPGGGPQFFTVSLDSFELMLDTILQSGMMGCSLESALRTSGRARVAITFDDGTAGQFAHAVPALRERGMTATFFVTVDWIGTPGFMTWEQLRELTEWGMSVQSHTKSHPFLSELDREQLESELLRSKEAIDHRLGQITRQIALPGGDAPRGRHRDLIGQCGYLVAANSRWGENRDAPLDEPGVQWVRRCNVPPDLTPDLAQRIITGDRRLAATRIAREATLNGVRALLGPTRYQRWRRLALDRLAGTA